MIIGALLAIATGVLSICTFAANFLHEEIVALRNDNNHHYQKYDTLADDFIESAAYQRAIEIEIKRRFDRHEQRIDKLHAKMYNRSHSN